MSDPFDLGAFQMVGTVIDWKAPRRRQQFVKVPMAWVERLGAARRVATPKVALRLLWMHFRDRGRPVRLSNLALARDGVPRKQKPRALAELERLGLVGVERRRRKAPIVTIILNRK